MRFCSITADLESRDYRGRTPLHPPAQVRVADKDGNMPMSGMIKIMPRVVRKSI